MNHHSLRNTIQYDRIDGGHEQSYVYEMKNQERIILFVLQDKKHQTIAH